MPIKLNITYKCANFKRIARRIHQLDQLLAQNLEDFYEDMRAKRIMRYLSICLDWVPDEFMAYKMELSSLIEPIIDSFCEHLGIESLSEAIFEFENNYSILCHEEEAMMMADQVEAGLQDN